MHAKSKSLYDESLVSKGIMAVSKLLDDEGELKNWETLSQEFILNPIQFINHKVFIKLKKLLLSTSLPKLHEL